MTDPMTPTITANGANIPAIGLGTYRMTGETCARAVTAALDAGYRHIDTARMYDNEADVGEGLRASGLARDDIFVTTKIWTDDIGGADLERAAAESLERLQVDAVDLLLIHWPNAAVPLRDSIAALCRTKTRGLARHIGVSNFPVALLDEAVALASEPLSVNQCEYHPRLDQAKVLAACRRHGIAFTSYCPLGRGDLTREPAVQTIAERLGRTPSQVILRWHVQQPGVVAIPKSATPAHIAQNIEIFDFLLSTEDMETLSAMRRPDGRLVRPGFAPAFDA